jgi:hypothetical protein
MIVVTYQLHGQADMVDKFFNQAFLAYGWIEDMQDKMAFCKVHEVFH